MIQRNLRQVRLVLVFALLVAMLVVASLSVVNAQSEVYAHTSGFGAAFAYAQTIGNVSYTQAGSLGNGEAWSQANTPFSSAGSYTLTGGASAAFAQSIGSPFGSASYIQAVSSFDGFAFGSAWASP